MGQFCVPEASFHLYILGRNSFHHLFLKTCSADKLKKGDTVPLLSAARERTVNKTMQFPGTKAERAICHGPESVGPGDAAGKWAESACLLQDLRLQAAAARRGKGKL